MGHHFEYDLGVIGGGAAGLTVTAGAAQLGAKALLIEREASLGGDCLHYGCVPSKTLIHSARLYHQIARTEEFGLPKIERPPVDFSKVTARIKQVIDAIQHHDSVERFCGLGARVVFGQAEFRDEHTVEVDGTLHTADKWVIATGSSSAMPHVPGLAEMEILTNREIFSLAALPASLLIIGGGPIAIEMAQAFSRLGAQVTVIQRSDQILSRDDADLATLILARLREEGIKVHTGTKLVQAYQEHGAKCVVYTDRAGTKNIAKAEAVLVALGRSPNLSSLGLSHIGVEHSAKGIVVDQRLRTSQPHIFAAGDVTGSNQFTHAAGYEGGIVLSNAIFRLPRKTDYTWLPWCTYTDPELAGIGMTEKAAHAAGIQPSVWVEHFADNDRAMAEGENTGLIKLILNEKERPIGVQILGPRAGDLLAEWTAVLNGGIRLSTLASAIHPYPTLAEINKRVAGQYLSTKIFSAKIKKALTFFFNLKGRACENETD